MRISTGIREVFGHFHNLNLLALVHDLRSHRTARGDWAAAGKQLCPLAHGLASGTEVNILSQVTNLKRACDYAAQFLGADFGAVVRFVRSWDEHHINTEVLLEHLEEIWEERLEDAIAVQQILQYTPTSREKEVAMAAL